MLGRASVVLLAALFLRPAFAAAQAPLPSYATARETIEGTIVSLDGKFALTLDDVRGFTDSVTLHAGTTVEPDGVPLTAGEFVVITGHADGKTFAADDVDTEVSEPDASAYAYATGDGDGDGAPLPAFFPAFAYVPVYGTPPGYWRSPGRAWLPPVPRSGPAAPRPFAPLPPAPRPPAPRPPAPHPPAPPPHLPVSPPRR